MKKSKRSLRQQWHSERNFSVQGTLKSCITKLLNMSKLDSTNIAEKITMEVAADRLKHLSRELKFTDMEQKSWERFKFLRGGKK